MNRENDYIAFVKKLFQHVFFYLLKSMLIIYTYHKNRQHTNIENLQELKYFYRRNDLYT